MLFLSLNTTALLLADAALVSLVVAPEHVPGGYWLLIYASAFEGLIGGTFLPIELSDARSHLSPGRTFYRYRGTSRISRRLQHSCCKVCISTPSRWTQLDNELHRSQVFSRFLGLIFTGMALGPSLGGLVERLSGNPYVIFYIALGLHAINTLFLWFIIPESLLPAQMDFARRTKRAESRGHWSSWIFSFLSPLAVLAPVTHKESVTPQKALKKDWSLTWLALSYAPDSLVLGGVQYSLQYAAGKFNWTGEIVRIHLGVQSTDFKPITRSGTT